MKILHLSKLYPPFKGGIETVAFDLVEETKKYADQVDVLCITETNKSSIEAQDKSVIFRCSSIIHLFSTYLSISYLFKWIKIRNNYDVVHIHVPNPLAAFCLFLFPTKSKIVVHWHSDIVKQKFLKKVLSPIHNSLLKRCEFIVATSRRYAKASHELSSHRNKLKVIPIGISSDRLVVSQTKIEEIVNSCPKHIILSLGRHVYYKGFEYLIDSAKFLSDDYVILIGGQGELTNALKQRVLSLGLEHKVKFIGRISDQDLGSYYRAASVFCLPSIERSEAFGVVQLEAMSQGIPIVSTNIEGSGVGWVNKHGVSGYVVPPKNDKALADAFVHICESRELDEKVIVNRFETLFSREVMANEFRKIYL
ncbi:MULTISPECIES: glycosyltransferase [Aeromonas]|uniref:glycosyltransferase n=1 Tax=Aeromonas TaxID=642 RepID=UPI000C7673D8|nr:MULTISPECIES: glycosyltransferase [Aeromonas]AWA07308.1 glycosyltransferase [Aeromonas hydrophila subsp. hydrophila]MBL0659357.1 glycosyltransferase [Aeromonas dhakensis]MCO4113561.1 glycosyltransferase [Aeromonas hydrophila]